MTSIKLDHLANISRLLNAVFLSGPYMRLKIFYEMINGLLRNGKYRYVVVAVLVLNALLINYIFADHSLRSNPFKFTAPATTKDPWVIDDVNLEAVESANSNVTPSTKPNLTPYIPTDLSQFPDLGPPKTPALLSNHNYDFNGPYVGWPLERLCNETNQTPGLVFLCDNNSGGIGNIRNFILTCIRYAIEAGASGIVLPKIQRRSEKELSDIFTMGFQPFSYFFDEQHFKYAMNTYCRRVTIYDEVTDIPDVERLSKITDFHPKSLNTKREGCDDRGANKHLDRFRMKFDGWLKENNQVITVDNPVTVRFKWATFFEWPIYHDGPEFANTFGDILRIRGDIHKLASATIKELSIVMGLSPNPSRIEASFLGAHLRTENDALSFWPKFNQQSDGFLKQAVNHNFTHIYLACGNVTELEHFAQRARDQLHIQVTSKTQLLQGKELAALQALTWDQQALVDYLVLQKSTFFTGCSFSSFAMNVAIKRHSMISGIHTRPWRSPGDQFSSLIGPFENWYGDWMFMFECMWP